MIRVSGGPVGKSWRGKVEIDGVDISNRVQSLSVVCRADGSSNLALDLILYGDDALAIDIAEEDVTARAEIFRNGERIDISAHGDRSTRYLKVAAKA